MEAKFYEPRTKSGKIVAFADVTIEGVVVKGFRVVDGENGRFAAVPSRPVTVSGQTRYWNQIDFTSKTLRERFLAELLEAYERWVEAGSKEPSAAGSETEARPEAS